MPYIGKQPRTDNFVVDTFTATAGQTVFTMSEAPASAGAIMVGIDGAFQEPEAAYGVSGTTLTLTSALNGGERVYVVHLGVRGVVLQPADGSVGNSQLAANVGFRLIARTVYTTGSGTHTYDSRTKARRALVQGAGGGGGGCDGQGAGTVAIAAGGGAGGFVDDLEIDVPGNIGASESYSIGAAGAGGAAGNNAGSTGGDSTLGTITASGGVGGNGSIGSAGNTGATGGLGGAASGGDINIQGNRGFSTRSVAGDLASYGHGADSHFGAGAKQNTGNDVGDPAFGLGAGGSGACTTNATDNRVGGDGGDGIIIIEEYA